MDTKSLNRITTLRNLMMHKKTFKPFLKSLLLLGVFTLAFQAIALEKNYKVEVLVISHPNSVTGLGENWSHDTGTPDTQHAHSLKQAGSGNQDYTTLKKSELTLGDAALRITQKTGAKIVLHTGWRQSIEDNQTTPVHIFGGRQLGDSHSLYELDGTISLQLSRYLHVGTDLLLQRPQSSGLKPFRIEEKHKIKKDEVLYIDHPFYGVLIKVTDDKTKA